MPAKKPISAEDLYQLKFVEDPQISPDGKYVAFVKVDVDQLDNKYKRHIWLIRLEEKTRPARQFTFGAGSDYAPRWRSDSGALAFVSTRNEKPQVYLIDLTMTGGEARPLTSMPNGASNPVWSPDGKRLAFLAAVHAGERAREDSGESEPPPASALEAKQRKEAKDDAEKQKADPHVITRLPYRTGTEYYTDRFTHIYVMNVDGAEPGKPYRLTDGDLNFNAINWTKDGSTIISTQSRYPDDEPLFYSSVVRINAKGKRRPYRIISQVGHEYFKLEVSPDGQWIAAARVGDEGSFGQRSRLVVMPIGGGPARELTADFDRSVAELRWAADARAIYSLVNDRGDTHLYRVDVKTGEAALTVGGRQMVLGYSLDQAGQIAFVANTPERPTDVYLAGATRRASSRAPRRLTDFNDLWLAEHNLAPIEEVWHSAPDGRRIQGWLLKPVNFRKGQKCPLVVHMHGGPWVLWGPSMPNVWLEWQLHAARGYAVYFCNPRGSEGYGEEHAMLIRNDWGDHVMHDILSGVDNITQRGFVDVKRMALTGGSYAGYMTAWIISHDHRFACAWAQRGLYNMISFFGTSDIPQLIEREFETMGFDEIEKLWRQSPLAYVRHIQTPLAIEHQDNDWRCPPSEAEQLFAALKRLKREVIFVRYPREGHEMSRAGEPQHRVDRLNRMVAWFDRHCKQKR